MTDDLLHLRPGSWYAWHMFPGYGQPFVPYASPVRIDEVTPEGTGRAILGLRLFNAGYASGVQDVAVRIRVLARRRHHLMAELLYEPGGPDDRHAVIGRVGREWLEQHVRPVPGIDLLSDDQYHVDDYWTV